MDGTYHRIMYIKEVGIKIKTTLKKLNLPYSEEEDLRFKLIKYNQILRDIEMLSNLL